MCPIVASQFLGTLCGSNYSRLTPPLNRSTSVQGPTERRARRSLVGSSLLLPALLLPRCHPPGHGTWEHLHHPTSTLSPNRASSDTVGATFTTAITLPKSPLSSLSPGSPLSPPGRCTRTRSSTASGGGGAASVSPGSTSSWTPSWCSTTSRTRTCGR